VHAPKRNSGAPNDPRQRNAGAGGIIYNGRGRGINEFRMEHGFPAMILSIST